MAECGAGKLMGKNLAVEYLLTCPDSAPEDGAQWKKMGLMRSKDLELAWDTIDTTTDDSKGNIRENMATFQTLSFSGDGLVPIGETDQVDNYFELLNHVAFPPSSTGGQPLGWLRLTDSIKTWVIPVLFSQMSESAPYDDAVTYSISAEATSSGVGVKLTRTPKVGD